MAKPEPKASVKLADFAGMVSAVDQQDTPPGATGIQVNMQSLRPGELDTRKGYRVVLFEAQTTAVG